MTIHNEFLPGYPQYFYRNALINGNFDIWQRGTSFVSPVTDSYCADRWKVTESVDNNCTISRSATVPDALSQYSARLEVSGGAGGANAYTRITQWIENYNLLVGKRITLSFKAKCDAGTTATVYLAQQVAGANTSVTISGTSWTKYILSWTVPAGSTALRVIFQFNRDGLAVGKGVNISQVHLSTGSYTLDYMPPLPQDEFLKCQRYFQRFNSAASVSSPVGVAIGYSGTNAYAYILHKTDMRTTATIDSQDVLLYDGSTIYAPSAVVLDAASNQSQTVLNITRTAPDVYVAGKYYWLITNGGADILLSAEL